MKEIYFTTDEICSLDDECDIQEIKKTIDNIIMEFEEWGRNYQQDDVEIIADKERYVLVWQNVDLDILVFYSRYEMARWCFGQLDSRDYFSPDVDEILAKYDIALRNRLIKLLFGNAKNYDKY